MILQYENVQRVSEDPTEIEELKSQGYVEYFEEAKESKPTDKVDFDSMAYNELKKYAKAKGIAGAGSLKKAELLEILRG